MNKIYYTYDDLKLDVSVIFDQYVSKFGAEPDFVVGITRGGLVPAVHLSHMFNVPMLALKWSTRDFIEREFIVCDLKMMAELTELADSGYRLLIVDDIFDSGETLVQISAEFAKTHLDGSEGKIPVYASLMTNQRAPAFKEFVTREVLLSGSYIQKHEFDWVVFPWEN